MTYPKLKAKLDTKGLTREERNQLLAYDLIWRLNAAFAKTTIIAQTKDQQKETIDLCHDIDANLSNLGSYIEEVICKGNLALHFEGFEANETKPIGLDILA